MSIDLTGRRERALSRHDKALERWPGRRGADFEREVASVAEELQDVAAAQEAQGQSAPERCRTWRYVGDALFDLAHGTDAAILKRAAAAYDRAESLVTDLDEPLERAKVDFNLGNIMRGISGGTDRALLEEALLRYQLALATFVDLAPELATTVQRALDTLLPQLKLLDTFDRARATYESTVRVAEELSRTPEDAAVQERARSLLAALQKRRSEVAAEAIRAVQDMGRTQPNPLAGRLSTLIDQLQSATGLANDPFQRLFPMLLARFRVEIESGRISAERQAALEPILGQLQALINQPEGDLEAQVDRMGQLRQLMTRMTALLAEPSTGQPPPPPGSRAGRVHRYEGALAQHIAAEQLSASLGATERKTATDLSAELAQARASYRRSSGEDQRILKYESDVLRPLAQRIGRFGRRHHLTLATPVWTKSKTPPDPSGVYACGAPRAGILLTELAEALALKRVEVGSETGAGQARFNAIAASSVVVCDLRLPPGSEFAAACYEIGLAKALGRAVVILVAPGDRLPFDIETAPVELHAGTSDREVVADAIDAALYVPPQRAADTSLAATIEELERRYAGAASFEIRKSLDLVKAGADDPIEARQRIESLLAFVGTKAPSLIFPTWPGGYPAQGERRLFHVMPFSLAWSNDVRSVVASACEKRSVRYVRGDEVPDPRVIRSIWDEICRASHVLVDLSEFNANVAVELGLVHGLGRHTLVVGQGDTVRQLFPAISKIRLDQYSLAKACVDLQRAVDRFIAAEGRSSS